MENKAMDQETRRTLELMLKYYEEKSFSKTYWKTNGKRLVLLHGLTLAISFLAYWFGEYLAAFMFLGMMLGSAARDIGYFRQAKRSRPIYDMVTDYDKVRRLLEEAE